MRPPRARWGQRKLEARHRRLVSYDDGFEVRDWSGRVVILSRRGGRDENGRALPG